MAEKEAELNGMDILFSEEQQAQLDIQTKAFAEHKKKIAEEIEKNKAGKSKAEIIKEIASNDDTLMKAILSDEDYKEMVTYDTTITSKIKDALKNLTTYTKQSIITYIELGKTLLEAKRTLGDRFYIVITEEIIAQKQVQRYIKLVLTKDSEEKYAKSMKAKKEDFDNIKMDKRILELSEDSIQNMKKPSMNKLLRMKSLSTADFKKVINGDDSPYDNLIKDEAKIAKENRDKELKDKQPDGMSDNEYKKLLKDGVHEILNKYQGSLEREQTLSIENKTLEYEIIALQKLLEKQMALQIIKTSSPFKEAEIA